MDKRDKERRLEKIKKRTAGLKKLKNLVFLTKPYFKHGGKSAVIMLAAAAIIQPVASLVYINATKKTVDAVFNRYPPKKILKTVAPFMLGTAAISIANNMITIKNGANINNKISIRINQEVNEKALRTDLKHYDNPEFYDSYTFTQQNYPMYVNMVANNLPGLVQSVATTAAVGVRITTINPALTLMAIAAAVIQVKIMSSSQISNADLNIELSKITRPINYISRMLQARENSLEMRTSGAGEKLLRSYDNATKKYLDYIQNLNQSNFKQLAVQGLTSPVKSLLELLYITRFIIRGDITKIGLYEELSSSTGRMNGGINSMIQMFSTMYGYAVHGERIAKFFETESIIEPPRLDAVPPPDGIYDVELRDISFRYENAAFGLEHFNLKIPAGQRVAIVGENGAGKSTLTKLLLRLYDVDSGAVLINGRDIRDYDVHALRRRIGIAYQDVRILAMSLRDNLTVYNDVGDDELREVIARLGLDSVLEKVGNDLDTMVSREFTEDGAVLSGGEAQRLSLARLFTGPFGLLLLDEPSSALDPLAEHKLMQTILDKSNTATTVMIAHRLSTVRSFDVIYHIEDGKIIETGTHDELMALHGKYHEMFTRQAENYQNEMAMAE